MGMSSTEQNKPDDDDIIHLEGVMNVCPTSCDNPSNSYGDISLMTTNVNLMVAREEKSRGH